MNDISSGNKRIAKNAIIMYMRMLFVMIITLYTVRLTLKILGVEDYGIYNVISMIGFVSISLQNASQRFYSYAIGERDFGKLNEILNLNIVVYVVLSVVVILLCETLGLWFLKNKLVIPEDRMFAAIWIYRLSIASFVVSIIAIPFSSLIIAHEHIGIYAVINVTDCILKLLIVFVLTSFSYDTLIFYGALIFLITLIKCCVCMIYCKLKYTECYLTFGWNFKLFKSVYSYSGWTLFASIANVANNQGNNILINIFYACICYFK